MTTVGDPKHAEAPCCSEVPEQVRELAGRLRQQLRALFRVRSPRDPIGWIAPELTSAQVHALVALGLDDVPLSMSALAQRMDAGLPAATGIVDRLERDGFVERLRDEQDRRVVLVGLTDHGRSTYQQADRHMSAMLCEFLGALPDTERASFVDSVCHAIAIVCGVASKPPSETP